MIGGSTVTNEAMFTYNKGSLGQAVNILPGVVWAPTGAPSINSSGARAEGDIFVRGFDRFQVPLSIDGVRIYLPADNRIDMNRFLTPDLAEVQVAKGYVSVLNGPGGDGGAINLVSRKPTKEIELEGRSGAVFDGDLGSMGQWSSYAYAGTRQKGYYAQLSGNIVDQDHFDLSNDFSPSPLAVHRRFRQCCRAFPTSRAATATVQIFRTGALTPRSASRRTRPTNTRSTTRIRRARRTLRSVSTVRSCRATSILVLPSRRRCQF